MDKGMIPKVDSAVAAIKSGVEKVSFVDGRVPHAVHAGNFHGQRRGHGNGFVICDLRITITCDFRDSNQLVNRIISQMKEIVPTPPPIVRNDYESIRELFAQKCRAQLRPL